MRVLYVGDTQVETIIAAKGLDTFTQTYYKDSSHWLRNIFAEHSIECEHLPAGDIGAKFPGDAQALAAYDVVLLSDVGYNNFSLLPGNRPPLKVPLGPNRAEVIREYVAKGGGLIMGGGWLTFSGLDGKGLWGGTAVEEALPVTVRAGQDDRVEAGPGVRFTLEDPNHPIVAELPWEEEYLVVGYNRVLPRADATVVASFDGDPAIVIGEFGSGRGIAYTTDPATHWGGTLLQWSGYSELWRRLVSWAAGQHEQLPALAATGATDGAI